MLVYGLLSYLLDEATVFPVQSGGLVYSVTRTEPDTAWITLLFL